MQKQCRYCNIRYRILIQHLEEFESEKEGVNRHIPSRYSKEMASKSEVVSYAKLVAGIDIL